MSAKIVYIENAIPSDVGQVGGEYTNQLTKLLKGGIISTTEEIFTIATPINFLSGTILLADESSPTHRVSIEVDNIASGGVRHAKFPTMDLDETQHVVMDKETQNLLKKTLSTGTIFGVDADINGYNIVNLKQISIIDLGDRDISLLGYNGTNPNIYFDILSGYNTINFAALSTATDIELRFGYNSEIDTVEFWSKASGTNEQLLKIYAGTIAGNNSKIDLNIDIIDFHNALINNISLSKAQIPATVVYDDEANTYALAMMQTFRSGMVSIFDSNNSHKYIIAGSDITADRTITIPVTGVNDDFILKTLAQDLYSKNFDMVKMKNAVDQTATTTVAIMYRKDIDANNQAVYINKIENGTPIKVRVT